MEIRVLNKSFVAVGFLEDFESFIWTEKYLGVGDFEIYANYSSSLLSLLQEDFYLLNPDSDRVMIVETIEIKTDPELGNKLVVKGRSLESILDRRIVLKQLILDGTLYSGLSTIISDNLITSIYPERNISGFSIAANSDPNISALNLKGQYYSENLLDVVHKICEQVGLGFKVTLDSSNNFVFTLYFGVDRSHSQTTNPYVVFSPTFDNLIKSNYFQSKTFKKNYVLVSGDPSNGEPVRVQVFYPEPDPNLLLGINRREMFVNASDIPRYIENGGGEIPLTDYEAQLTQRGKEELAINSKIILFDGEVDPTNSYKYRQDFFLGDYIQIVNEFGMSAKVQVVEMTFSDSERGNFVFPTLKTI